MPQFVKHFNRPVVRISVASIIRFYNLNKLATGSPREIRTASNSSFALLPIFGYRRFNAHSCLG